MKRTICSLITAICLAYASFAPAQTPCPLSFFSQLPLNTTIALSPTVYNAAVAYPDVANALVGAHDAWNVTDAAGRLGSWNGAIPDPECPAGQPPFRISAFNFFATSCPTVNTYNAFNLLAFVDYYSPSAWASVGINCPYCGTKSMSLNLYYYFSTNPQPNQYDIWSVVAHEFGHMLGLWHMTGASCGDQFDPLRCGQNPNRNTMGKIIYDGDSCERDLSFFYDIVNANSLY